MDFFFRENDIKKKKIKRTVSAKRLLCPKSGGILELTNLEVLRFFFYKYFQTEGSKTFFFFLYMLILQRRYAYSVQNRKSWPLSNIEDQCSEHPKNAYASSNFNKYCCKSIILRII
jgi:hypothetical protein